MSAIFFRRLRWGEEPEAAISVQILGGEVGSPALDDQDFTIARSLDVQKNKKIEKLYKLVFLNLM
jgi:hypothetical protein